MDILSDRHHRHRQDQKHHPILTTEGRKLSSILEKKLELPTFIESKINKVLDDLLYKANTRTKKRISRKTLQAQKLQRKKKSTRN